MSTMLRQRSFRIKRRARLKTIRSMSSLFFLYKDVSPNYLWHHQLKTKRITNYHKFGMIFLFSTLKIQRKKHKLTITNKKIIHTKIKALHTITYIQLMQCMIALIFVCTIFFCVIVCAFFSLNFQCTKNKNHSKLMIICYSFCLLLMMP